MGKGGQNTIVGKPINYKDMDAERHEYLFKAPNFVIDLVKPHLNDAREVPMIHLLWNILTTTVPVVVLQYLGPPMFCNAWFGAAYVIANYVLFLGRFLLTLHYSQHRKLFRYSPSGLASVLSPNNIIPYILTPLYGVPSGQYYVHHVVMHHVENNVFPYDVSSTMPYQRDSFVDFLKYWLRYACAIWVELPYYCIRRGRYELLMHSLVCNVCYFSVMTMLYRFNPVATTWVFIVPALVSTFLMMLGNFSQHIFVDPREPNNSYRSAYICINSFSNQISYNDSYHVLHHLNSKLHWSEFPTHFAKNVHKYYENETLVFHTIDVFAVGFACFTKNLKSLLPYVVHLGPKKSDEEMLAIFKMRLQKIDCDKLTEKQKAFHPDQED